MSGSTFPPSGPTTLQQILAAYVYREYADDDNIQAFNSAYNGIAQSYLDWFNQVKLPVYTSPTIAGSLLDWVGAGLYGLPRPSLASGQIIGIGPLNTWAPNTWVVNTFKLSGVVQNPTVTDDIYKRIITWWFYKGDGFQFSIPWLKRRIMRFLTCSNGTTPNIGDTYPVSITFGSALGSVIITISLTEGITLAIAEIFQDAVLSGAICLPFQLTFTVAIAGGVNGFFNDGGFLGVISSAGYPSSATGLADGAVWDAGGVVYIIPGVTPNPAAPPLFFGIVTAPQLLSSGGGNLPTTDPNNALQLWNNAGIACVSLG